MSCVNHTVYALDVNYTRKWNIVLQYLSMYWRLNKTPLRVITTEQIDLIPNIIATMEKCLMRLDMPSASSTSFFKSFGIWSI
jgi:hypothetical protein